MTSTTINKLLKTTHIAGDNKTYIFLEIKWEDEQISIKILDSETSKSYQGVVKAAAMKEIASNLDMSYSDYYEEMRAALSTYLALPGFYYKLEPEMEVLNVWKAQPESIPILFLDIDIKEVRSKNDILDSAIEMLHIQNKSLKDRQQKAHKFDEHTRDLLEDNRLCLEEKKELERKLLKKVSVLLNAKKERIAHLEVSLKKHDRLGDAQASEDSEENEHEPEYSKKRRLLIMDSESESEEYMANTELLTMPNK